MAFWKANDEGFERVRDFEKLLFGILLGLVVIATILLSFYAIVKDSDVAVVIITNMIGLAAILSGAIVGRKIGSYRKPETYYSQNGISKTESIQQSIAPQAYDSFGSQNK